MAEADFELASVTQFRPPPPPHKIRLLAPTVGKMEGGGKKGAGHIPTEGLDPGASYVSVETETASDYDDSVASMPR